MIINHKPKDGEFEETKNTLETEETKEETTEETETPAVEVVDEEGNVEAKTDATANLNPSDVEVPVEAPSDVNPDTQNSTEVVSP